MNDVFFEILKQNDMIGGGLSIILVAAIYIVAKMTIWWGLFGTAGLLAGKYGMHEWCIRTVAGLTGFTGLACLSLYLLYMFDPESTIYMIVWSVSLVLALRVWLREIFSLFGLLRGDWSPFHPKLRFLAWRESYIFRKSRKAASDDRTTPWGSYADMCDTHTYYQKIGYVK